MVICDFYDNYVHEIKLFCYCSKAQVHINAFSALQFLLKTSVSLLSAHFFIKRLFRAHRGLALLIADQTFQLESLRILDALCLGSGADMAMCAVDARVLALAFVLLLWSIRPGVDCVDVEKDVDN